MAGDVKPPRPRRPGRWTHGRVADAKAAIWRGAAPVVGVILGFLYVPAAFELSFVMLMLTPFVAFGTTVGGIICLCSESPTVKARGVFLGTFALGMAAYYGYQYVS